MQVVPAIQYIDHQGFTRQFLDKIVDREKNKVKNMYTRFQDYTPCKRASLLTGPFLPYPYETSLIRNPQKSGELCIMLKYGAYTRKMSYGSYTLPKIGSRTGMGTIKTMVSCPSPCPR